MRNIIQSSLVGLGSFGLIAGLGNCSSNNDNKDLDISRPNIIYILSDDIGYGDIGPFGQTKIETPNLDKLASEGMIFTNHYTGSPVCAPARCILLTGLHSGKSQIRRNDEMHERGEAVRDYVAVIEDPGLEGQRPMIPGTLTIGSLLQTVGYKTAIIGKWGLGAPNSTGVPNKQGFDFFFGYNCQRQAHTYYPVHLWKNDRRVYLNNDTVRPHIDLDPDADPYDLVSYDPFNLNDYAPTLMFEEITRFVNENHENPFFLYWASPISHSPLQAPREWVDYYVSKFGDEEPYTGTRYFPHRYPRAAYAAMISYLDHNVGRLIQQLKELGIYDNTLIVFTSDNGPTAGGGTDAAWFQSAAPFQSEAGRIKGSLYEGGIRVPMIASWPEVIEPGSVTDHISVHYDVMPTLAEILDIPAPGYVSGTSFLPTLRGEKQEQPEFLYWEYPASGGQMAVRMGNFKALRTNMFSGNLGWELFDLGKDPQELTDISSKHPDIIARVEDIVAREHTPSPNPLFRFSVLGE
jgi:arylsulfatase A-like enzyme